jgi:hypothetical protein
MEYTLTKMAGLRWRVAIKDGGTFNTSSIDEALAFIRNHAESRIAS